MRRDILLPLLAVAGGGAGFALRYWQRLAYFDGETMLFVSGAPAMLAVMLVLAALALDIGLLCWGGQRPLDYQNAFLCPGTGYMLLMAAGSFLMLGAGGLGILQTLEQLRLWRAGLVPFPIMTAMTSVLCIPGAAASMVLGQGNYRGILPKPAPLLATIPAYALLPWLVAVYQDNSRQPDLASFALFLLGVVCAEVGFYAAAAFAFDRPRPWICAFFSLVGAMLLLTSLADRPGRFYAAMSLAVVLLLLGQSCALLRSCFGPPWPKRIHRGRVPDPERDEDDSEE